MTPDEVQIISHFEKMHKLQLLFPFWMVQIFLTGGTFCSSWQRNNWSVGETANARHSSPGWGEEDILMRED